MVQGGQLFLWRDYRIAGNFRGAKRGFYGWSWRSDHKYFTYDLAYLYLQCKLSNHENITHEMSQYCWTTNILSPENYPLYGISIGCVAIQPTNLGRELTFCFQFNGLLILALTWWWFHNYREGDTYRQINKQVPRVPSMSTITWPDRVSICVNFVWIQEIQIVLV